MRTDDSVGTDRNERLDEALAILDRYFGRRNQEGLGPGLAVALTDRSGLIGEFAYGFADACRRTPVTPDTLFQIGSITKTIIGTACMRLAERRALDLDAPVTEYLDWFDIRSPYAPITVHHLLTHTAGIASMIDSVPASRFTVWLLRETDALFPPGERFHYSNVGYGALGYVLENAAGLPLVDVIRSEVVEPLKMGDGTIATTHELFDRIARGHKNGPTDDRPPKPGDPFLPVPWFEFVSGCGSFTCAPRDLAAFLRMFLNRGEASGSLYLHPESLDRMTSDEHMTTPFEDEYVFGYGLFTGTPERYGGHRIVKMGGENLGYEASMIGDVDDGVGVVIFVNSFAVPLAETDFALRVLQALARGEAFPEAPRGETTDMRDPKDVAGVYRSNGDPLVCEVVDGKLVVSFRGERADAHRLWGDTYQTSHSHLGRDLLRFARDEETGKVVEAISGALWFRGEACEGPDTFEAPAEWTAYIGHYRSFAPLIPSFRVVLRKGRLIVIWAGGYAETTLVDDGDGRFHSDPPSFAMEQVRFDAIADGRAQRCTLGGGTYVRVDTP